MNLRLLKSTHFKHGSESSKGTWNQDYFYDLALETLSGVIPWWVFGGKKCGNVLEFSLKTSCVCVWFVGGVLKATWSDIFLLIGYGAFCKRRLKL
jgi:hypothetical protein